jgi:hypothetical protein
MKKILMILTNARTDCLGIALELLTRSGSLLLFDRVVFLLNAPRPSHLRFVDSVVAAHPEVRWDRILGPGTRPEGIARMQNECVRRYPDSLYLKLDEDVFTPAGWVDRLVAAYELLKGDDHLGLLSPLIPNNAMGLHILLTRYYPDLLEAFRLRFGRDPDPTCYGLTWQSPEIGAWATRRFIDLEHANAEQRRRAAAGSPERLHRFPDRFSIGCICYDYRLWKEMGGIPPTDEPGWCAWIQEHGFFNAMDASTIVLHYSFFVQQDWLDRTHLLEDIRRANLRDTLPSRASIRYWLPWARRLAAQAPRAIRRKFAHLMNTRRGRA